MCSLKNLPPSTTEDQRVDVGHRRRVKSRPSVAEVATVDLPIIRVSLEIHDLIPRNDLPLEDRIIC
jgi:hypothetical protein